MNFADAVRGKKIYDLGQPMFVGMPHHPAHPPYLYSLNKLHGDFVYDNGASSSSETITLGGHVGTHIDALTHFSCDGKLHGGVAPEQSYGTGIQPHSADTIGPIIKRAVLYDVARMLKVEVLPRDFEVTVEHLESFGIEPPEDGIALVRTGFSQYWHDPRQFLTGGKGNAVSCPGPSDRAAHWLSARRIFAAGSDTIAFELAPSAMNVHVHLIVEKGIHIIECLDLEEIARDGVKEFTFFALPMKIRGGTGSPIRPIAIAD